MMGNPVLQRGRRIGKHVRRFGWYLTRVVLLTISSVCATGAAGEDGSRGSLLGQVRANWKEPGLELSLPGGSRGQLVLGEHYQVLVASKVPGKLYLLRQNSSEIATGKLRLIAAVEPLAGYASGTAYLLPPEGSFVVEPPIGSSRITALLSNRRLNLAGLVRIGTTGAEIVTTEGALAETLAANLTGDANLALAMQVLEYEVNAAEGALEFTTRGITQQIVEAQGGKRRGEVRKDAVLTSFDAHVEFAYDSANPTPAGRAQLDAFGDNLSRERFAGIRFVIAGHTDDVGSESYNLQLSNRRAAAVADYLHQNFGIERARMSLQALGESKPLVENTDERSRAKNRRVEFILLE